MIKILITSLSALWACVLCAQTVNCYPEAQVTDIPLVVLKETDPAIQQALKAGPIQPNWFGFTYTDQWMGFIKGEHVLGVDRVQVGTPVYLMPSTASAKLTVIEPQDHAIVVPDKGWVDIRLSKPIHVYFQPTPALLEQLAPKPEPKKDDPGYQHTLQGTLALAAFSYQNKVYDYQLLDTNGHTLAYLDFSQIVMTRDMHLLIGSRLSIQGMVRTIGRNRLVQVIALQILE